MLDGGGGVSRVTGPHMQRLQQYLLASDPDQVGSRIDSWNETAKLLDRASIEFEYMAKRAADAFSESSLTAGEASRAFTEASEQMQDKAAQLRAATKALSVVQERYVTAKTKYEALMTSLPTSHGPAPSADDPKYAEGPGRSKAEGDAKLADDRAAHAREAQAIADAEREAAQQCGQVDDGNQQADPPVRAITEEPDTSPAGAGAPYSSAGSRSAVVAAQARHDSVNSGTLYPDGWGHEIKAEQRAIIDRAMAENKPEWADDQGLWVNADGSPAEATSYASVETAEGLAPLSGGLGGAAALGVGLGGAGLAAGAMAALKAKFAAGAAARTGRAMTARSAGGAKAATPGSRSSMTGAGQRSSASGAGSRSGAKTGPGGAGSRAGRGGPGSAGGRGGKKDKKGNGSEVDYLADYEDDWSDAASNVLDPEVNRGWQPKPDDGDGPDLKGKKKDT